MNWSRGPLFGFHTRPQVQNQSMHTFVNKSSRIDVYQEQGHLVRFYLVIFLEQGANGGCCSRQICCLEGKIILHVMNLKGFLF